MTDLKEHREPTITLPEIVKSAGYVASAGVAATVGGVVALGTSGCCGSGGSSSSSGNDYEAWANTDGAAGRINMQAVQEAFDQATDPSDFENRINEIWEGDNTILIKVYTVGTNQFVEGWEDLVDDGNIVEGQDDKIFTLNRNTQTGQGTLNGHGVNSYYSHSYPPGYSPMGGFFTGYLMASLLMRPYYTSPMRRTAIRSHVSSYRTSPRYSSMRTRNAGFYNAQRASNPRFNAVSKSYSPARSSFRGSAKSTGNFRRSGTGRTSVRGGGR